MSVSPLSLTTILDSPQTGNFKSVHTDRTSDRMRAPKFTIANNKGE